MSKILNITNGDGAVDVMRQAEITGDFLPWRDVLHEGPVPAGLPLSSLSEIRARFITNQGWADHQEALSEFVARDSVLESYQDYSKAILWFEHDLYDQLQLLQILDWFSDKPMTADFTIICTENYLGPLQPDELKNLFGFEQQVTEQHLLVAKNAWQAFCSDTPQRWAELLQQDTAILPFLHDAVLRMLEEYPSPYNGLSRTQQQALRIVSEGEINSAKLFARYQQTEQRRFLGDVVFWSILKQMMHSSPPLLALSEGGQLAVPIDVNQELSITPFGLDVLRCKRNWLEIHPLDRWLGGVHLSPKNIWFWDSEFKVLHASSGIKSQNTID